MGHELKAINLGGVNCYLLNTGSGFVLIDTGFKGKRAVVERGLAGAGCGPGDLMLIIRRLGTVPFGTDKLDPPTACPDNLCCLTL